LRGASARLSALNSISAFLNPTIQGVDKTIKAFKENPVQYSAKAGMYITTPTLLLYWANYGDKRIDDLPQWRKDLFWHIKVNDTYYPIPKPFEIKSTVKSIFELIGLIKIISYSL
jgi:hypothetical protein